MDNGANFLGMNGWGNPCQPNINYCDTSCDATCWGGPKTPSLKNCGLNEFGFPGQPANNKPAANPAQNGWGNPNQSGFGCPGAPGWNLPNQHGAKSPVISAWPAPNQPIFNNPGSNGWPVPNQPNFNNNQTGSQFGKFPANPPFCVPQNNQCACEDSDWPDNLKCNCCSAAGPCWPADPTLNDGVVTETISTPCCMNGNCKACDKIACDVPWLQPKAVACGRPHTCNFPWEFALHPEELDRGDLPGRPPHTIVCVRADGNLDASVVPELMIGQPGNSAAEGIEPDPCRSYDLYLCVRVPVNIIVRDCTGFLYCLTSMFSQIVKVPLVTRVRNLVDTQIYLKARVRLCDTVPVRYPNDADNTDHTNLNHAPTALQPFDDVNGVGTNGDKDELEDNRGCYDLEYAQPVATPAPGDITEGFGLWDNMYRALPTVRLDILIEACVMRLIPFGIVGDPECPEDSFQATHASSFGG